MKRTVRKMGGQWRKNFNEEAVKEKPKPQFFEV